MARPGQIRPDSPAVRPAPTPWRRARSPDSPDSQGRNLHPDQASYLRGKRYNLEKAKVTNADGKNQHSEVGGHFDPQPKTADKLAAEYQVSPATIKRVAIGRAMEEALKATERRGRPKADTGQADLIEAEIVQNFAQLAGQKSRQVAAEQAGFGNAETYRQAKTVVEHAEPELIEAMAETHTPR